MFDGLQVLHEPCYDTLRTKQQLGYSVHSGVRLTHGILGFAVCVVSGMPQANGCDHACTVPETLWHGLLILVACANDLC